MIKIEKLQIYLEKTGPDMKIMFSASTKWLLVVNLPFTLSPQRHQLNVISLQSSHLMFSAKFLRNLLYIKNAFTEDFFCFHQQHKSQNSLH